MAVSLNQRLHRDNAAGKGKRTPVKRQTFAPFFIVYLLALPVGFALRVWLKLEFYDIATGFYNGGALGVPACNTVVLAAPALLFLFSLLRRPGGDHPMPRRGTGLPLLLILLGAAMFCAAAEIGGGPWPLPPVRPDLAGMPPPLAFFNAVLGGLAALGMVAAGWKSIERGRLTGGVATLPAAVWMIVCLVSRFNVYETIVPIADNLLAVLFMGLAAVFFAGHARTLSGLARKDGRNYVIPAGLSASLFAFLLVVPNWVRMAIEKTAAVPALHLGAAESVYIFTAGVYALVFVIDTCRRIARV